MYPKIFTPTEDLADFVKCYWTLESSKDQTPQKNTIIPDGTMKLIFHYGDLYWHHPDNGEPFLQPRCFLIGQLTKPYVVEPKGDTGTFVVRFYPNGFLPFTTIPIKEMENTPIPLERLFGEKGLELESSILKATSTEHRIHIIEAFLYERLTDSKVTKQILKDTVDMLLTANGQLSVQELSKHAQMHRRVLNRKFASHVGLSPKQLSRIIRLQTSLKTMLSQEVSKLTDVAYDNEYYDQAHFIKEFKEFTGTTPKEFYGDDLKMSLIFDQKK